MRARSYVLGLGFVTVVGFGCSATGTTGGMGGMGGSGNGGGTGGTGLIGVGGGGGTGGIGPACAKFTAEAKQAPAALLFVVDASSSMGTDNKWTAAQEAIIGSIDKSAFDNTGLGLTRFPSNFVDPPDCICDDICTPPCLPTCKMVLGALGQPGGQVACGSPTFPSVPLADSGLLKSNDQTGVRHAIYQDLVMNYPLTNDPVDSSPVYDAMEKGYQRLKDYDTTGRVMVVISDGGFSCTSISNRSTSLPADGFGCADWEHPDTVNTLISGAYNDPAKPIFTFIIGVPGSDSNGEGTMSQPPQTYDTAPYRMRRALSTYAYSGAPNLVPAGCDHMVDVSTSASNPNPPCHFDLSQGSLDADALAAAIDEIRGKALGCVFDIPAPPPGETIDLGLVNVVVTIDGVEATLPKRVDPMDSCAADGCWDFKGTTQVEIIGKTCSDLTNAMTAKVDILVGCQTITK